MRHWNYRVIKHWDGTLQIHEVHYDADGRNNGAEIAVSMSEKPSVVIGDDVDEMKSVIEKMKEALDKPALSAKDMEE